MIDYCLACHLDGWRASASPRAPPPAGAARGPARGAAGGAGRRAPRQPPPARLVAATTLLSIISKEQPNVRVAPEEQSFDLQYKQTQREAA